MLHLTYIVYVRCEKKVMAMTSAAWQRVHDRHDLTQRVLRAMRRRPASEAVSRHRQEIEEVFGSLDGFLLYVEHRWRLRVETALDQVLEPGHPVGSLGEAKTLRTENTARLEKLLAAFRDHPALRGHADAHAIAT